MDLLHKKEILENEGTTILGLFSPLLMSPFRSYVSFRLKLCRIRWNFLHLQVVELIYSFRIVVQS